MTRARAKTLVLVNWKGVFYDRYELNDHVTALEGDNAAGKTTVMIAAYAVLLPDMTRLRFTNVGEGEPTGGDRGIYGRLGVQGCPSYAFVEFVLHGGTTLLAGVRFERKTEPSVELTPLMIEGLPSDVALSDVLLSRLGENDRIPELEELRESTARQGARLTVFRSAKDYFTALFDHGITPLRLLSDHERSRFNEMLRTSMTGGLSRALTSGFRTFLLDEESGLADMLIRMRGNLEACRRTRTEVGQARKLEQEISGIFEAGDAMFATAMLASKERALECRRRVDAATRSRDDAADAQSKQAHDLDELIRAHETAQAELRTIEKEADGARTWARAVSDAHVIAVRLAQAEQALQRVEPELRAAERTEKEAEVERTRRRGELEHAQDAHRRAAEGLAKLQDGLDELQRRAHAHRTVVRRLGEARDGLHPREIDLEGIDAIRVETDAEILGLDRERSAIETRIGSSAAHRLEHIAAMHALAKVVADPTSAEDAHRVARHALARFDALEQTAAGEPELRGRLPQIVAQADEQRRTQQRATALATDHVPLRTSADVRAALEGDERELDALFEQERDLERRGEAILRDRDEHRRMLAELDSHASAWREVDRLSQRLEEIVGVRVHAGLELQHVRRDLETRLAEGRRTVGDTRGARDRLLDDARALDRAGGLDHADLVAAAELVGGDLVANFFEDVEVEAAGPLQARLGPLAHAIVVEDPAEAAQHLVGSERGPDTLWLVSGPTVEQLAAGRSPAADGGDVIVGEADVVRVTRVPERPTLGRKTRERRAAELRARADDLVAQIASVDLEIARMERAQQCTELLLAQAHVLERGDPTTKIAEVGAALEATDEGLVANRGQRDGLERDRRLAATRVAGLRDLLGHAALLDEPDLGVRCDELRRMIDVARDARTELERTRAPIVLLRQSLDALRRQPATEHDLEEMQTRSDALSGVRGRLSLAIDALVYVAENRHALAWTDAADELSRSEGRVLPALQRQCDAAKDAWQAAETCCDDAETRFRAAQEARAQVWAEHSQHATARQREHRALTETGIEDASSDALAHAERVAAGLDRSVEELRTKERDTDTAVAVARERLSRCAEALASATTHLESEMKEWRPSEQSWERLRTEAERDRLITPSVAERLQQTGRGSPNLRSDARVHARSLVERLGAAADGAEIVERIQTWLRGEESETGEAFRQAWVLVLDWLQRRMPTQIAEVDDTLEALRRLRERLTALDEQLIDQEEKLRGASKDVAQAIGVHIRRAHTQVRRLNQELAEVRFGTIAGIEIHLERNDQFSAVLDALKTGSAQELLFGAKVPIEEALEELLRRHAGGRSGGERLLDYREYLDVGVRVRRQGKTEWEQVNPSRLSTGEAIGVGAALMMVVLTAWERTANLFRAKRSAGTLRLLFLDEANRLSTDNLGVLFDLCENLDLQLLIAAPQVEQAHGCTTYRLVRRISASGDHEVIVSGRRSVVVS